MINYSYNYNYNYINIHIQISVIKQHQLLLYKYLIQLYCTYTRDILTSI